MAKTIRYGSYCVPQEQVSSGGKFYLDGDCRMKLGGNNTYTITTYTAPQTTTSTVALAGSQDFVAIKALSIDSGTVLISLDNGDTTPIKLLTGECFASKIASGAVAKIVISGWQGLNIGVLHNGYS